MSSKDSSISRSSWDFGRFIKTLSYFGAMPLFSRFDWFQHMFGSRLDPTVDSATLSPHPGIILVVGDLSPLTQSVIETLVDQEYKVRSLVDNISTAQLKLGDRANQVEWFDWQHTTTDQGMAQLLTQVRCIVGLDLEDHKEAEALNESTLKPLMQRIRQNLKTSTPVIFDFTQPDQNLKEIWGAVDDVVMGGVSESSIRLEQGMAFFSGTVSTANSGGFASIRTRNFSPAIDLSGYDGIELRLNGDGNRYKFLLRCEDRWDGIAYSYSFDTVPKTWLTIQIPFAEMIPVFRAKSVPDAGAIATNRLTAFQLMLSKFEYDGKLNPQFTPGFFQLSIASIGAYGKTKTPPLILVTPSAIDPAIAQQWGVPDQVLSLTDVSSLSPKQISEAIACQCRKAIDPSS